eukprot:PLAT4209.1.p1 GENE.PLAT4209.1~~PLAT4209.1.p1  ORF type:complete len:388 (+),score=47.11 PLAT4209.1:116-1165(+)
MPTGPSLQRARASRLLPALFRQRASPSPASNATALRKPAEQASNRLRGSPAPPTASSTPPTAGNAAGAAAGAAASSAAGALEPTAADGEEEEDDHHPPAPPGLPTVRSYGVEAVNGSCLNSAQGKYEITDARGFICARADLGSGGCCLRGHYSRYSCSGCNTARGCCATYETCVACCSNPERASEIKTLRFAGASDLRDSLAPYGPSNQFLRCLERCRTNSRRLFHENRYLTPRHYCMKEMSGGEVKVIAGDAGLSCAAVCRRAGGRCDPSALSKVNRCDQLLNKFGCERGCQHAMAADAVLPAYVDLSAARNKNPGACMLAEAGRLKLRCQAKAAHVKRLCACRIGAS